MKKRALAIVLLVLAVAVFLLGNRAAVMWQSQDGVFYERLTSIFSSEFFASFSLTFNTQSVLFGLLCIFFLFAFWFYNFGNRQNTRAGKEHGSAKWAGPEDAKPFQASDNDGNIILSKSVGLALSNEGKDYLYHTNKNILVLGGSGSGKTRFFVKPNLLQRHSCYIVTDPKGTCLAEVGNTLKEYDIRYFNTVDLKKSMKYNPLAYAHTEQDILKLVDALMLNTSSPDKRSGDQFWQDAEKLLYTAIIAFILFDYDNPANKKNFNTFLDLFGLVEVSEDRPDDENVLDELFANLESEKEDPPFSLRCYRGFRKAHPKTAAGIIISACARLMPFYISDLRNLFDTDEMELDRIGTEWTAHFLIVDDTDSTFDFIVGLLYSQMLTRMIRNADANGGKLPIHTRLIMDEAANIAQIRNLEKVTGQIRSREISACLIYQNPEQLKALYKEKAAVISGNFDTTLFLGSDESSVAKLVSEKIGDETVNYTTKSETRGRNGTFTQSEGITKRRLLTPEEVRALPADECIVFIKGLPPIRDKKYVLEKHPRFKDTADFDSEKRYKLEKTGQDRAGQTQKYPAYTARNRREYPDGLAFEIEF